MNTSTPVGGFNVSNDTYIIATLEAYLLHTRVISKYHFIKGLECAMFLEDFYGTFARRMYSATSGFPDCSNES